VELVPVCMSRRDAAVVRGTEEDLANLSGADCGVDIVGENSVLLGGSRSRCMQYGRCTSVLAPFSSLFFHASFPVGAPSCKELDTALVGNGEDR
jgi:hypothetical protein